MESVEEMMKRMQLSVAEKKGIKVGAKGPTLVKAADPQAVGKVLAEKLVNAEGLGQALGRVLCPIRGVGCRDLGETTSSSLSTSTPESGGRWRRGHGCLARIW